MITRRKFIHQASILSSATLLPHSGLFSQSSFSYDSKRPPLKDRNFTSKAVEDVITEFKSRTDNELLAWLFENCFPNTLDTTVDFDMSGGLPDTYVITGDIDAMWLRDSSAQVWPYLPLMTKDDDLRLLIAGVIRRQVTFIHLDPYANAFYKDYTRVSKWTESDLTLMRPGVHERKWEIDSLCYPIRLAYGYWKHTGDTMPLDKQWLESISLTVKTFTEQQRKENDGPYKFQRKTAWATDGVPLAGYGYPTKPVGLISSMFRPSDDATVFPFLIPSNYFAVVSLRQAAEMVSAIHHDQKLATACLQLAEEVSNALAAHATTLHRDFGQVLAYEVNGFGSFHLMDDANVPSLLSLPYLGAMKADDPLYLSTRALLLSTENPFFFKGKVAEGIGGPHAGMYLIWPMSIIMRAMTSNDDAEIRHCIEMVAASNAGHGFIHETFHKDDFSKLTRSWFAWANTLFGELLLDVMHTRPHLLK